MCARYSITCRRRSPAANRKTWKRSIKGTAASVYRTEIPAGPAGTLDVDQVHDFAWVFGDGQTSGVMDRRGRRYSIKLPARTKPMLIASLVESLGHVNFGNEIHDRKGLLGSVKLATSSSEPVVLKDHLQTYRLPLDATTLHDLKWKSSTTSGPAFWRGSFDVAKPADTFLDLTNWGHGVVWINGRCLARFWNIGPTQTAYLPGAWLTPGANEVIILDLVGPTSPMLSGLEKPILNVLRPELDFGLRPTAKATLLLGSAKPTFSGTFAAGSEAQEIKFKSPVAGRQFCLETLNAQDGKPYAAIAELDLIDAAGNSLPHQNWSIAYVDSEELSGEDGSATNAIDGQTASFWHTAWKDSQPNHPHHLVIDLGNSAAISGFRYTPRAGAVNAGGRIKDYRIYIGDKLAEPATAK